MLSILIPTKDYKIGLQRIIKNISEKNSKIKIIISDDSTNNEIEKYIKKLNFSNISYSRNAKTLGLAGNFNKLLKQCKSRYLMFIHHDDYINDRYFFISYFV
jgi:glycosyltransferase involved in cell wall biosynthesis